MKKKIAAVIVLSALCVSLVACGNSSTATADDTPEEKVYVSEDEIPLVLADPDAYKGQYIVLTGKVFNKIESSGSSDAAYQAYYDIENYEDDFVIYCDVDTSLSDDDYIEVDGQITGSQKFETYLGVKRSVPCIQADSITDMSYIDAVVPALAESTPADATAEQQGVVITVDKVEYAETETRIWITETNDASEAVSIYPNQARIVQGSSQYDYNWDSDTSYYAGEDTPTDHLLAGVTSSGMLVFPALDPAEEFQLYFENCYSDDYNISFDAFVITVPAAE